LLASYRRLTGRDLVDPALSPVEQARAVFEAPFAVVSHDTAPDPVFNYGNRMALGLWGLTWEELTALPSRLSAEPVEQATRARLLAEVAARGFIDEYEGVRVTRGGRRFRIHRATVWNVTDEAGRPCGQAATFASWTFLD
jgi:PAS domain-containing protein